MKRAVGEEERKHRTDSGQRVRNARETAGHSREFLAERLDVSTATLYNYETGQYGLSAYMVLRLAEELRIDPLFLLTGQYETPRLPAPPPRAVERILDALGTALTDIEEAAAEHRNFYESPLVRYEVRRPLKQQKWKR